MCVPSRFKDLLAHTGYARAQRCQGNPFRPAGPDCRAAFDLMALRRIRFQIYVLTCASSPHWLIE
jgi:hypothetical protein